MKKIYNFECYEYYSVNRVVSGSIINVAGTKLSVKALLGSDTSDRAFRFIQDAAMRFVNNYLSKYSHKKICFLYCVKSNRYFAAVKLQ